MGSMFFRSLVELRKAGNYDVRTLHTLRLQITSRQMLSDVTARGNAISTLEGSMMHRGISVMLYVTGDSHLPIPDYQTI